MTRDLRFAFRQLVKAPGFTAVAVLTLAVAIGINSAVFAVIGGFILRPVVPVRAAEVVGVYTAWKDAERDYRPFSYQEFRSLRDAREVFSDVAAIDYRLVGLGDDGVRRRSFAALASSNLFSLLGARPARGRFFEEAESLPNANIRVAVASDVLWKRMGGREDFVGSTLRVNGRPYTVIGVAPRGFSGVHAVFAPELWLPLGVHDELKGTLGDGPPEDLASPRTHPLNLLGRLRPGLTIETARGQLSPLAQRLTALQPSHGDAGRRERDLTIDVPPRFSFSRAPNAETPAALIAALLAAMAAVVLLIASLNLANMLLARGTARAREIAVRRALGASRGRIVRQLLAEGFLLALAGGAAGLVFSVWTTDVLAGAVASVYTSINFAIVLDLGPDWAVVAATLGLCVLATLVFSLGPALEASKPDLVVGLKRDSGEPARSAGLDRFFAPRHLLVMAQMALCLALLFSAGLFVRSASRAAAVDPGFRPAGALVAEMDFTLGATDLAQVAGAMSAALSRARQLPAVTDAAIGTLLPYGDHTVTRRILPASAAAGADGGRGVNGIYTGVSSRYFAALGIPILRGRDFTPAEIQAERRPPVTILDQTMAAALFPDGQALGRHVRFTQPPSDGTSPEMEVVGIVGSHRHEVFGRVPPRLFVPLSRAPDESVYLYARLTSADARSVRGAVFRLREALRAGHSELPLLDIAPLTELMDRNVGLWLVRTAAVLFGLLGGVALLLAVVGVYGVKSYAVARRTREIGIRVALGAQPGDVLSLVLTQGALQTVLALAVGAALALATGRILARVLYQVSPADPLALFAASAVLAATALAACLLPARRATRVSPMSALRSE
jgi:putative ABC transport system permease protein